MTPGSATLDEAIGAYVGHLAAERLCRASIDHVAGDLAILRRFLVERHGRERHGREGGEAGVAALAVASLSPADAAEFVRYLRTYRTMLGDRPLTRGGVVSKVDRARKFFRFLAATGATREDLGAGIGYLTLDLTARTYVAVEEAAAIIEAPDVGAPIGIRDRAIMETIYGCALRHEEARALRLGDVDLGSVDLGSARLVVAAGDRSATARRSDELGGTVPRAVPIPSVARVWLGRYIVEVRRRIVEERGPTDALFLEFHKGERMNAATIYSQVRKARERAGIRKQASTSILRDAAAVHLLAAGAETAAVRWFLGVAPVPDGRTADDLGRMILAHHPRHRDRP